MRERQRTYELMFIITPLRNSEEEINATISRVQQSAAALGGEITNVDHGPPWGRRKFAYPIREYAEGEASRRAFTEGYYVLCHLRLPTTQVGELERALRLNESVLRYLMTLVDAKGQPVPAGTAAGGAILEDEEEEDVDEADFEEEGEEDADEAV